MMLGTWELQSHNPTEVMSPVTIQQVYGVQILHSDDQSDGDITITVSFIFINEISTVYSEKNLIHS